MKKDKIYIVIIIAAVVIFAAIVILDNIGMSSEGQKRAVYAKEESPDYDIAADFADSLPDTSDNNGLYYYGVEPITLDESFVETMLKYPVEDMVGKKVFVDNPADMESLAGGFEDVWFKMYDESIIIQQRPYTMEFDFAKGLWIVKGTNVCTGDVCLGILNVMISAETGEVLSAWGMK